MRDALNSAEPMIDNEENYDDLIVSIEANQNQLNLLIAVCDNPDYRDQIIQQYEAELTPEIDCYQVQLARGEPSLKSAIAAVVEQKKLLQTEKQAVITVTGTEQLYFLRHGSERSEQEIFFGYLQWTREALRQFPFSIVLWVTTQIEQNVRPASLLPLLIGKGVIKRVPNWSARAVSFRPLKSLRAANCYY